MSKTHDPRDRTRRVGGDRELDIYDAYEKRVFNPACGGELSPAKRQELEGISPGFC